MTGSTGSSDFPGIAGGADTTFSNWTFATETINTGTEGDDIQIDLGTQDNDFILQYGPGGNNTQYISGATGDDWLEQYGGAGSNNQSIYGGNGNDFICQLGGDGNDILFNDGGLGNDRSHQNGGSGNDWLAVEGAEDYDYICQTGGTDDDIMTADSGVGDELVIIDGGPGNDAITYNVSDGTDYVFIAGGTGNDTLTINATSQNFTVLNMKGEVLYQQGTGGTVIWIRSAENITVQASDGSVSYQVTDAGDTTGGPDISNREVGFGEAFAAEISGVVQYQLTVSAKPGGTTDPPPGSYTLDSGTQFQIRAIPDTGYVFSHWSGDANGTENPITITMDSDKSVRANFVRKYTLTLASSSGGTTEPGPGTYFHDQGTEVTVTASPAAGYRFSHWSGGVSSSTNPITITMDSDKSIKANFIKQYTLILASGAGGTIDPPPGTHIYDEGMKVALTAIPNIHYRFSHWSGAISSADNPMTVTMDSDKSITANFIRLIHAPLNFSGQKVLNRSLSQAEYINVLTWQPNPDNVDIAKYRIYLGEGNNQSLLVELNAGTFQYWQRRVEKDRRYPYAICAVNNEGREGERAYVAVQ